MSVASLIHQLDSVTLTPPSVCYVYDEAMTLHAGDKNHPERPDRIRTIHEHLLKAGLLAQTRVLESRTATVEELALAHTADMVANVMELDGKFFCSDDGSEGLVMQKKFLFPFDHDTYVCHASTGAALLACGSVLNCVDEVLTNKNCSRGFAAIRPPGHHATAEKSMGFCLFNNVAVAARYAQEKHRLSRVAILDWDVHHGNGTGAIFSSHPSVLFMSIHRHDRGKFYPGTGAHTECGESGRNVNCAIDGSFGDEEILYAFDKVVLPALAAFKPELLLVSAGFDAAENDPLGQCRVRPSTYGTLTRQLIRRLESEELRESSGGRILLVLEGGYNLDSIAAASVACMHALLGEPSAHCSGLASPASSDAASVRSVPTGVVKSSVVSMVHDLTVLMRKNGLDVPEAPPLVQRSIHKKKHSPKHRPAPKVMEESPGLPLLTSGGGHENGVSRFDDAHVLKRTTIREALAYLLVAEAAEWPAPKILDEEKKLLSALLAAEKKRINFDGTRDSLRLLSSFVSKCVQVKIDSATSASVVLEDLTFGLDPDEHLGVLDIKLGTEYHTPEDAPERILTRRQKAAVTSASSLGIRLTACRCADGFSLSKRKAATLKTFDQMVPVVRRFLFSPVDDFHPLVDSVKEFLQDLKSAFKSRQVDLRFIAASVLLVVGRSGLETQVRCKLIDLAHMYPSGNEPDGFIVGCTNLIALLEQAREPSYESA